MILPIQWSHYPLFNLSGTWIYKCSRPFVERIIFPSFNFFSTVVKNQLMILVWVYFHTLIFVVFVYDLLITTLMHVFKSGSEFQFSSVTQYCQTLCYPRDCSTPGFSVHHQLPELAQTNVHRVNDAIQPSHPLSSPSPPAFNLSQHQGLLQWVSSSHQVAKVLEFQLQHQSSNEYSGLISFRTEWFDLLVVQGTLKSLLQHHSSKASILQHSAL